MEFIASFSFLHCQFLPLLTGDPPPFAFFNLRSFYELPLPIPPPRVTPVRYSRFPLSFFLSRFLLPSLFRNSLAPAVTSLGGECAGIQTAKPVRMSLGRHFPSSLWQ